MGPLKTYGRRVVWSCVPLINHFTTAAVAALQHVNCHRERLHREIGSLLLLFINQMNQDMKVSQFTSREEGTHFCK